MRHSKWQISGGRWHLAFTTEGAVCQGPLGQGQTELWKGIKGEQANWQRMMCLI